MWGKCKLKPRNMKSEGRGLKKKHQSDQQNCSAEKGRYQEQLLKFSWTPRQVTGKACCELKKQDGLGKSERNTCCVGANIVASETDLPLN